MEKFQAQEKAKVMRIGNAVEIGLKGREFWEPITPEKVNKVYVRQRSADDLSGWSSPGADAARIGDLNEDVRQKEGSANDAGLMIIEVNHNRDALDFACFDTSCCADSFKHLDRRREVPEGARDKDVLFADSGAAGSADGSGRLESNLVAPLAGQQSVESLNSASTPVFNTNIPSSNVDDQCIVSSFEAVHDKPTGPSIISTPSVTSTPMQIHEPKIGINQNKRPRQQKPKRKKHTPKVIREGKPRRTPKHKDLGSTTPLPKKKKQAREKIGNDSRPPTGDINEGALKDAITEKKISQAFQPDVKSCRRHLDFGDGNVADQHCGNDSLAGPVQSTQDSYIGTGLVQSRRDSYIADQTSSPVLPPRKPVNRKSQCLNRIRRIGQNFPKKFKKKRTGRKKRTSAMEKMTYMLFVLCPRDFYVSYPRHLKKKRRHSKKKRTMKRNANRFESPVAVETQELEIPVSHHALVDANAIGFKFKADQQTSDGTGKGNKKRKGRAKGQEKSKGAKLKLRQELKRIIQKIMELKIGDDVENREDAGQYQNTPQPQGAEGVLVLYKAKTKKKTKKKPPSVQGVLVPYEAETKKKRPRVELDAETIQRWKQSMLLDDGGARDEEDKDNRKWERERGLFRGRVESFLVRMHLILGDRHFTLWKGSVVDSIIGVFLTQNVSDYLSSNAFMSLASKFPIYLVNGEQNGEIADKIQESHNKLEQILEQIVGKGETVKIQESHNILEQILEQIMGKEEIVGSQGDIKHENGHAERQASPSAEKKNEATKGEKKKKGKVVEKKTDPLEWEKLRRTYSSAGPRIADHMDSVDWDAVRRAGIDEIAATIKERGQHNQLAKRIHHFLNELVRKQGSIDLEWLRNCPPDKVKEYLLEVHGLGLKSVECIRLLALQHVAFPVDTNVCRIAVRLGWVPLEPLPGNLQIHLLENFPILDEVQKYLWPRLRELDQRTLYELHYHLITFGKVFCTKTKPNCNACPMRGECKHFASAYASARLSLPAPKGHVPNGENTIVRSNGNGESTAALGAIPLPESGYQTGSCEPIIEEPASPKIASKELLERDIEDFYCDDGDELLTINLSSAKYSRDLQSPINDVGMSEENSRALVALHNFIPMPKLKEVTRLRTEHYVYELPDSHPLLRELPKREADDPCSYLLLIRTEEEAADSFKSPNGACDSCNEQTFQEESHATIKGTLLIPCRTFLSARFPLNGTYFQVNEVFADHESSHNPIDVPRRWIWNLRRRIVYFGTSASSIFKGLTMEKIQSCFRNGFICIRGIDRKTGAPRPLIPKFHRLAHKAPKLKKSA